jgi:hypothetical protein
MPYGGMFPLYSLQSGKTILYHSSTSSMQAQFTQILNCRVLSASHMKGKFCCDISTSEIMHKRDTRYTNQQFASTYRYETFI